MKSTVASLLLLSAFAATAADSPEQHFADRVKPLLESRCVSCHGTEKQKGGLRLDSREAILKGGDTGPALVAGKPGESLLLQSVMHAKKELAMPPKEKLTAADIAVLERWVRDGAPWPKDTVLVAAPPLKPGERIGDAWSDPRNPIVRIFGGQRLDLWSLKPVQRPAAAEQKDALDILLGTTSAPSADPRTLIRRVTFDLTGLPPAPEEVDAFMRACADGQPSTIEAELARLADRLLASPRYGEHWARLWLDVVRYSDSNGFDWDEFRPRAWRFRDYVVRAFNTDKPFDRFIREQLAGDELLDGPPRTAAGQDLLIATGYLRLGPQDNSAGGFGETDRARAEWLTDLTETTGSAFLGLTLSCCRCHDHKYDPLSQADHYRLRAFFEPIKAADDTPLDLAPEQEAINQANKVIEARTAPLQKEREKLLAAGKERVRAQKKAKLSAEEQALIETPKDQRNEETKKKVEGIEKKIEASDEEVKKALNETEQKRREQLKKEIDAVKKEQRPFTLGLLASDKTDKIPVTHVLFQGDHKTPREAVVPGFPSALDPNPAEIRRGASPQTTGRRLALAEWIASPKNPLTARVIVNRVWQTYFGEGLVATPNDFGLAGSRPTNAALLDFLASEFVRDGWSLKKLHRRIVMSAAYRASATAANRKPRRLSAEQLRDAVLAVSGLLQQRDGGPPVWPDLPADVLQANPAFLDDNAEKTKGWYPSPKEQQHVRSLYLVQKRTVRVPFMETFDLPENSTSCARRNESTVAPQALSLLNSPLAVEAARAFAARIEREAGTAAEAQIQRAFALAFQRIPTAAELAACRQLREQRSLTELCRALLNVNEFIYVD